MNDVMVVYGKFYLFNYYSINFTFLPELNRFCEFESNTKCDNNHSMLRFRKLLEFINSLSSICQMNF